uniref:Uncharacterized protein n=1 Tax=Hyaloperonospora arabidopsidis (strain Emoy2) TaxID=559515 RepID=M4C273_HYAAE
MGGVQDVTIPRCRLGGIFEKNSKKCSSAAYVGRIFGSYVVLRCNGVPLLHDNLHKVNIKYEYCVRINTIFSQYYPDR